MFDTPRALRQVKLFVVRVEILPRRGTGVHFSQQVIRCGDPNGHGHGRLVLGTPKSRRQFFVIRVRSEKKCNLSWMIQCAVGCCKIDSTLLYLIWCCPILPNIFYFNMLEDKMKVKNFEEMGL